MRDTSIQRICVVGPSTRFLSGITYYTYSLANALAGEASVSAILMRGLLPRWLYPGRARVGGEISHIALAPSVPRYDGVDWYGIPSLLGAVRFLARIRPTTLVLQWWTGTVLHSYLVLAGAARLLGIPVVIEFHEALDTGEERMAWASRYVGLLAPRLFSLACGYVVHSSFDQALVCGRYGLPRRAVEVIPHATYDHYRKGAARLRAAPEGCRNLLYFGIIRPYKGLEDLIRAFNAIPPEQIDGYWLTVVGETWEGWVLPAQLIAASPYRNRITFVNRYVSDHEVDGYFGGADVVVLPYHRSSQSGPLHVAMHYGLPLVVTRVGGLVEAVEGYEGAILTEAGDPAALCGALCRAASLAGQRFADPRGWSSTAARYLSFLAGLGSARDIRRVAPAHARPEPEVRPSTSHIA